VRLQLLHGDPLQLGGCVGHVDVTVYDRGARLPRRFQVAGSAAAGQHARENSQKQEYTILQLDVHHGLDPGVSASWLFVLGGRIS
jgi:hypothetical protein